MPRQPLALSGVRLLSLALNLPGPAALQRCRAMGATCVKIEPPAGDPMVRYSRAAYEEMQTGVKVITVDLKSAAGQRTLDRELAKAHVLLTSFRPSALEKLGLGWKTIHARYPELSQVAIVGAAGDRAEEAGHDLTYVADNDLLPGLDLPATLYADMAGSLIAVEAILQAALLRNGRAGKRAAAQRGARFEVALADAVGYLALPREWALTGRGDILGGAHAGYRIYECRDGRVAVAALEPHFAAALCASAGLEQRDMPAMMKPESIDAIGAFFGSRSRRELDQLAVERDIPLHTLPRSS